MASLFLLLLAVMVGAVVAGTGVALDSYLLPGKRDLLFFDLFAGAVAGVLSYLALRYQRSRHRLLLARLKIIAEMNHHIRNDGPRRRMRLAS